MIIMLIRLANEMCSYGHTRLKAPGLVRSLKLSKRWPGQYCGGRPRGNTGCRSFASFLKLHLTLFFDV